MNKTKETPLISVVVCTYNRSHLLVSCLQSLINQTLNKQNYEILVVNNNSTDDTQTVVESFARNEPNFRVVLEKAQGLSNARNRGWCEALGCYVAYIDDDARANPSWCEKILSAFRTAFPAPVAVGGTILPWYEEKPPAWLTDEFELRSWGPQAGFLQPPRAQNGFSGSNMAFRRDILERYGGFSTDYGMIGGKIRLAEETELFRRIYKNYPFFWYDPSIIVSHWVPVSNMHISYRLKRAFKKGEASARLDNGKLVSFQYLRNWIGLGLLIIRIPSRLWGRKTGIQAECVKVLQDIAWTLGSLV